MSHLYRALNHSTGEIIEAPTAKQIYDAVVHDRAYDRYNHITASEWTLHRCDENSECFESFERFNGVIQGEDYFPWAF